MPAPVRPSPSIDTLRAAIEPAKPSATPSLPFGIAAADGHLASGGLAVTALHEVAGASEGLIKGIAPPARHRMIGPCYPRAEVEDIYGLIRP